MIAGIKKTDIPTIGKIKVLNYGYDKFITLEEHIDTGKLAYIVNNPNIFSPLLKKESRAKDSCYEFYDPVHMAAEYLNRSIANTVAVDYRQREGVGRYNAIGGLSLQCLTRQIRQTIAPNYVDIDMSNAHPRILKHMCEQLDIPHPILASYVNDRAGFFKRNKVGKPVGKQVMLAVINGGNKDYRALKNKSQELIDFYEDEIKNIHNTIAAIFPDKFNKHKEARLAKAESTYSYNPQFSESYNEVCEKEHKTSLACEKYTRNHEASFMNIIMCDIENQILHIMRRTFGGPNNCVLCFDGIMLKEGPKYDIPAAEKAILDDLGLEIKLEIKPFEDAFDLSKYNYVPGPQNDSELTFDMYTSICRKKVVHESVLIKWMRETIKFISNGGNGIFITKRLISNGKTSFHQWEEVKNLYGKGSYNIAINVLNPKYNKEMAKEYGDLVGRAQKKYYDNLKPCQREQLTVFKYKWLFANNEGAKGFIQYMHQSGNLSTYSHFDHVPYLLRNGNPFPEGSLVFNTFRGFDMDYIPLEKGYDFEGSRFYKHLSEQMIPDPEEFNHFIDFVADIIQDPANIKGTAHLFYSPPGCGKGLLMSFIKKLIGERLVGEITDVDSYFGRFNKDLKGNLVNILEECGDAGRAFKEFNRIKADITKETLRVEGKFMDAQHVRNTARMLFFTNHRNALYTESNDRRITYHELSTKYADNKEYFEPLFDEINNPLFCRAAFEYLATRPYKATNVRTCINTAYKKSRKLEDLNQTLRFVKELVEDNYPIYTCEGDSDRGPDSFIVVVRNIHNNLPPGLKVNTFTTQLQKIDMSVKRIAFGGSSQRRRAYVFNTAELERKYSELLKDPTFKFDIEN
jgi:hypothetical protein